MPQAGAPMKGEEPDQSCLYLAGSKGAPSQECCRYQERDYGRAIPSQSLNGRDFIFSSSWICSDLPEVVSWTPRGLPFLLILKGRRGVHIPWHGKARFTPRMRRERRRSGTWCCLPQAWGRGISGASTSPLLLPPEAQSVTELLHPQSCINLCWESL